MDAYQACCVAGPACRPPCIHAESSPTRSCDRQSNESRRNGCQRQARYGPSFDDQAPERSGVMSGRVRLRRVVHTLAANGQAPHPGYSQQRRLVQDATQGDRKRQPIEGMSTACRHLLAQRSFGAVEISRHGGCRTESMSPSQAGHQGAAPCGQMTGARIQIRRIVGIQTHAHPKRKDLERGINAVPPARSHKAGRSTIHQPGHRGPRSDSACRQDQATSELPSASLLLCGSPRDPAAQSIARYRNRIAEVPQHGTGIETYGWRQPQGDPKSPVRVVGRCLASPHRDRAPCQHAQLVSQLRDRIDALGPVGASQNRAAHGLRLTNPSRHHVANRPGHTAHRIIGRDLRHGMDLGRQDQVVDQDPPSPLMRIKQPGSDPSSERRAKQEVTANSRLPTQAPHLRRWIGSRTEGIGRPH